MTLFIFLIATTNLALGYAMAVYLGHGRLPGRIGLPPMKKQAVEETTADTAEEIAGDASDTQQSENSVDEEADPQELPAATSEASQLPADEPVAAESENEKDKTTDSPDAISEENDESIPESTEASQDPSGESPQQQAAAENAVPTSPKEDAEDMLAGIEAFRAQLADMHGPAESSTDDSESEAVEETEEAVS